MKRFLIPILFTGLLIGTSCSKKEDAIFVTLQGSDQVENVILQKTWDVPTAHYLALSPDEKHLLVSSISEPNVYLFNLTTNELLETFEVGPIPQGVMIGPKNRYGIAVSEGANTVSIIDIQARENVKTIPVGNTPHNAIFTKDGKRAYVTLQGEGKLAILDMQTLQKIDEFPTEGIDYPHNLTLSEDEKTIWIRDFVGNVAAVDVADQKVLAIIPVSTGHAGIDLIAGGRYVFTGGITDNTVDVIDPTTFEVVKKIEVGHGSHGVRSNKKGDLVYVGVTGTGKIAVIDPQSLTVKEYLSTGGEFPFWVAIAGKP